VNRAVRALVVSTLLLSPALASNVAARTCDPDGVQTSGAIYRICMPSRWNGDLVLYAHGYVAFNEPIAIPESQLTLPDGTSIPALINSLGFAFATTSYSTNGLAILQGLADMRELVTIFNATHGQARRVFIVGPSEGGLITTLAIERHPDVFAGGVAACGPIGSFRGQINYIGDFRVVFDYFFPGVIPGSPIVVPAATIESFESVIVPQIRTAIQQNPDAARQLLGVTGAAVDPDDPATIEETVIGLAWYAVFSANDAREKLGGQPFGNLLRLYTGSDDDRLLNRGVARFVASGAALNEIQQRYETTGRPGRPLVTIHTTGDEIVPYWHAQLYGLKTLLTGAVLKRHINLRIERYGHCNFTAGEALAAFAIMLVMAGVDDISGVEAALSDSQNRATFRRLTREHLGTR
jgi:pimeloyl-ACP methyl ester carboxylesterase